MRRATLSAVITAAGLAWATSGLAASPKRSGPSLTERCALDDADACASRAAELAHDGHDLATARIVANRACRLGAKPGCALRAAIDGTPLEGAYVWADAPVEAGALWGRTTWTFADHTVAIERAVARPDPTAPSEHVFCTVTVTVKGTWDVERLHVGGPSRASSSVEEYTAAGPVPITCEVSSAPDVYTLVSDDPMTLRGSTGLVVLSPLADTEIDHAEVLGR